MKPLSATQKRVFLIAVSGILGTVSSAIGQHYPQYAEAARYATNLAFILLGIPIPGPSDATPLPQVLIATTPSMPPPSDLVQFDVEIRP